MARTAASTMAGRSGFSLPELVMVLVIVALLSGLAVPRYAGALNRYRADAAAARVAADLRLARSLAVAGSQTVTLRFRAPDLPHTYDIPGHQSANPAAGHYTVDLAAAPYRARIIGVELPDAAAVFDGHGAPAAGGTIAVGAGDVTRTIVLDPETGEAGVR